MAGTFPLYLSTCDNSAHYYAVGNQVTETGPGMLGSPLPVVHHFLVFSLELKLRGRFSRCFHSFIQGREF